MKTRLQKFITDYRTSKARVDLEYNKKLYKEAKLKYEEARDNYVRFSDSHRDVSSQSARTKESDLQNEMQIRQQIMQQVVAQMQQADMKVQENTPAFTTLQSATVPVLKAGPKRAQMCLIFLFLAFLATTAWILYKEDDLKTEIYAKTYAVKDKIHDEILRKAVSEKVILQSYDSFGHRIYVLPVPASQEPELPL